VDQERERLFHIQALLESDGWSVFMPGLPVAADGATFDDAITEMIDALREYAEDWEGHLLHAPNHRDNWGLVQLISYSDDDQLRDWLIGEFDAQDRESDTRDREFDAQATEFDIPATESYARASES
jgi:predicted RNase H-like HicB family nuclease